MGRPTLCTMAFRSIRDHSHMRFADSFTQDMDFWRQRVNREEDRRTTISPFAGDGLDDLPRNPFRDSGGMLLGKGAGKRKRASADCCCVPVSFGLYRTV